MKKIFVIILMILQYGLIFGQEKGIVVGQVRDSINEKPLESATIEAFRLMDNSRIHVAVSNSNGWFRLLQIPLSDSIVIQISFAGYESFRGLLMLEEKRLAIPAILLRRVGKQMDTVLVTARPRLMTIKKDTVEFNAVLFKTLPNAMAGDLLKKIPGLTIDDEGHLVFNGHTVSKILVDGKVFFGIDGRVALANIPVDLIKKIQISVDESPEQESNSNGTHKKTHTLNVRLKEGNKFFGNARAGSGTDNRYELSGLVNRTNNKEQLSVLGVLNNTNKTDGIPGNGLPAITSNGGGITRSLSSGLNYSRNYKNNVNLQGAYEYGRPVTVSEWLQEKQQHITADSSIFSSTQRQLVNRNSIHTVTLELRKNYINFNTVVSFGSAAFTANTHTATTDDQGLLLNQLQSNYTGKNQQGRWLSGLSFTQPFTKKDRLLWVNLAYGMQWQNSHDGQDAHTVFYKNNVLDSQVTIRQGIEGNNKNNSIRVDAKYTEPLSERLQWKLSNTFMIQQNDVNKTTWDLDGNGNKHSIDSLYSNAFTTTTLTNTIISGFNYMGKLVTTKIGLGLQLNALYNNDRTRMEIIRNKQLNLVPDIEISIGKNPERENWGMNMNASTNSPTRDQLQPVTDNTNPLNTKIGNPGLRSSVEYNAGLSYFKLLSLSSGSAFSVNWSYSQVTNKIIPFTLYDSLGRQLSGFVNIDGAWSSTCTISANKIFRHGSHEFSIATSSTAFRTHDRFYLNEVLADVNSLYLLPNLHFRYTRDNIMEVAIHYTPSYGLVKYVANPAQNQAYWIQRISGTLDLYAFKRLTWKNNLSYSYNGSYPTGFNKSSLLWNTELAWLCFKNKKGEIKLTSFDLLKQNRNISRIVADNYVENNQTNNLQQYFMIGLYWQFSKLNQSKTAQPK